MHLSVGKLHKILGFVSLIKPSNKEDQLLAMQMGSEILHLFLQPLQYCKFVQDVFSCRISYVYIYV